MAPAAAFSLIPKTPSGCRCHAMDHRPSGGSHRNGTKRPM